MINNLKYFKRKAKLIKLPVEVSAIDNTYNKNNEPLGGFFTDDFKYAEKYLKSHKDVFIYTIIVDEGDFYITSGFIGLIELPMPLDTLNLIM